MLNDNMVQNISLTCLRCDFWSSEYEDCLVPYKDRDFLCPLQNEKLEKFFKILDDKTNKMDEKNE